MLHAITTIIYATKNGYAVFFKAGMALLGSVIGKILLIDMAGLERLWRVAAFMGLRLALMELVWVYQKVRSFPTRTALSRP